MVRDLLLDRPDPNAIADVCIVGAGAAGIVLAVELSRLGKRVLLLEGGGAEIEPESQDPYRSVLTGLDHNGIHTGRFRAKGGTTRKWGGQILELDEQDFERRPGVPGSGWPFPKSALTKHYQRSLHLEGLAEVQRSDEAVWREIGLVQPAFEKLEPYFSRWCPDPDFARLHRQALEQNDRVTLWLHANVTAPIFDGETLRGLRCRTLTGIEAVFHATEYVFCLGTIESSRFFLQPGQKQFPWQQSGLLGKHFQDHVDCNVAVVEPLNQRQFHQDFDNIFSRGFKYHPKLRLSPRLQAEKGTLNVAGTITFTSGAAEALDRLKSTAKAVLRGRFGDVSAGDIFQAARNLPLLSKQGYSYSVRHRAYNPPGGAIALRVHCEQEPCSNSAITLADSRDALGMLRTSLRWEISPREVETIRQYVGVVQRALSKVARLTPDADLMEGNPEFVLKCDDSNHHMGGMRMAASAHEGIVDPDLLLHGTRNVYICSSAVFPTSGFSNPTHTLLALTVRLAEHLT
jgi:choline dehydrogenase-like flavoprotein